MFASTRSAYKWNKDWKPGPYPTTPEERAAAAKKYNLLPEEYEPSDEMGDYPKLPDISGASKDPHYHYDMPALKKDYGEPMHEFQNFYSEDKWDCNHAEKQLIPMHEQVFWFICSVLAFAIPFWYFGQHNTVSLPHMKKHYPTDGPQYKYP